MKKGTKSSVQFKYSGCSRKEITEHEVSFNEEEFRDQLQKCFGTKLGVSKIQINILSQDKNPQADKEYECSVYVRSKLGDSYFQYNGSDAAKTTRSAIKSAIKKLRKQKQKLVDTHKV